MRSTKKTLWVDKSSKRVVKVFTEYSGYKITVDITYPQNFSVKIPSDAKTLSQLGITLPAAQ